jgi:Protein of unknown function (DUF1036)
MRWILALLIFGAAGVLWPSRADANVHFCNTTGAPVSFALAMRWTDDAGAQYQAVRGWYTLEPFRCETPSSFEPWMESVAFYYAPRSNDGSWNNNVQTRTYCADPVAGFTYWNSFEETPCPAGGRKLRFRHIDVDRDDMLVLFLAPDVSVSV